MAGGPDLTCRSACPRIVRVRLFKRGLSIRHRSTEGKDSSAAKRWVLNGAALSRVRVDHIHVDRPPVAIVACAPRPMTDAVREWAHDRALIRDALTCRSRGDGTRRTGDEKKKCSRRDNAQHACKFATGAICRVAILKSGATIARMIQRAVTAKEAP